eukprot:13062261-Ditylum_brightwellii.AAC.1
MNNCHGLDWTFSPLCYKVNFLDITITLQNQPTVDLIGELYPFQVTPVLIVCAEEANAKARAKPHLE